MRMKNLFHFKHHIITAAQIEEKFISVIRHQLIFALV
jgi:hypothetical protein